MLTLRVQSDGSDEGEEEEEDQVDEDGETDDSSFVGRRNNVAGGEREAKLKPKLLKHKP